MKRHESETDAEALTSFNPVHIQRSLPILHSPFRHFTMPHVLIIGGGIVGPSLAIALASQLASKTPRITSTIFEIRPSRSDSGGSISLAPNALRVLDKTLGVYDRLEGAGYSYDHVDVYSDDGYRFGKFSVGEQGGYPAIRIMRSELHKILLARCEELGVEVKWGAEVEKIVEGQGEGVKAYFKDGSTATGASKG